MTGKCEDCGKLKVVRLCGEGRTWAMICDTCYRLWKEIQAECGKETEQ